MGKKQIEVGKRQIQERKKQVEQNEEDLKGDLSRAMQVWGIEKILKGLAKRDLLTNGIALTGFRKTNKGNNSF